MVAIGRNLKKSSSGYIFVQMRLELIMSNSDAVVWEN